MQATLLSLQSHSSRFQALRGLAKKIPDRLSLVQQPPRDTSVTLELLASPGAPGHTLWDMLSVTQRLTKRECSETSSLRKLKWAMEAELDMNQRGRKTGICGGVEWDEGSGQRGNSPS